jgi:hypothetical protein
VYTHDLKAWVKHHPNIHDEKGTRQATAVIDRMGNKNNLSLV